MTYQDGTAAPTDAYLYFCRGNSVMTAISQNLFFSRVDGKPFYVEKIYNDQSSYSLYVMELDGTLSKDMSAIMKANIYVKRRVLGVARGSLRGYAGSYVYIYSCVSPYKYRISNGRLYQQEKIVSDEWLPVQKIKLGTCDIYNGDVVNLDIRSAQSMQWQTDGNYLSTI